MTHLLKIVSNSIWHAFHALQHDTSGYVNKSKLKVLTANIGTLMDLYGVEKGLDHYRSTQTLNFQQYIYYLQKEVFSSLADTITNQTCRNLENGIDEICWLVCKKLYLDRSHPILKDDSVYQLFRIFCMLAEMEPDLMDSMYLVTMHSDEVALVASQLVKSLGLHWDASDFSSLSEAIGTFRFPTFLAVLESKYCGGGSLDINGVTEAVDELFQIYVEDVIKKGHLMKKGYLLPTMKCYWFLLRPGELLYYKDSHEKEPLGTIFLNINCWADAGNHGKPDRRFILSTSEHRNIELIAEDHRGRLQWLSAIQIAVQFAGEKIGYQRSLATERRSIRLATRKQKEEIRLELQHERQARIAAEIQARELEAISREECAKVQELKDVKKKLEILLQQEKEALRDEEIVRALQARVLSEEWEKREQMERLQLEQQQLLESEKLKRMEFEEKQQNNEKQLHDAQLRLKQLEIEKQNLDKELSSAREKVKQAEDAQIALETQIVTLRPFKTGERIRRSQSFIPTTKERPLEIDRITLRKNC